MLDTVAVWVFLWQLDLETINHEIDHPVGTRDLTGCMPHLNTCSCSQSVLVRRSVPALLCVLVVLVSCRRPLIGTRSAAISMCIDPNPAVGCCLCIYGPVAVCLQYSLSYPEMNILQIVRTGQSRHLLLTVSLTRDAPQAARTVDLSTVAL